MTNGGQETDNRPDVFERHDATGDTFDPVKNDPKLDDTGQTLGGPATYGTPAMTDPGGDSNQQVDTSTGDTTRNSCGNNTTDMNDCEQLVAAVTNRANAAKHKADTNDATGKRRFMTYGAKSDDNLTGESTDVMAPDGDPRQDDMVSKNDRITDGDIDDVITEFSNIDMSDFETLAENVKR